MRQRNHTRRRFQKLFQPPHDLRLRQQSAFFKHGVHFAFHPALPQRRDGSAHGIVRKIGIKHPISPLQNAEKDQIERMRRIHC